MPNPRFPTPDAGLIPRERLAHLARKIHALGERVLFELLVELASGRELSPTLERYARLKRFNALIQVVDAGLPQPRLVVGLQAVIRGLIAGVLSRTPEVRQSKAGRPYLLATVREGSGDKARWISAFVFADEAREAVAGMGAGDAIAMSGEIDAEIFTREGGQPRVSWSIRADAVLTAQTSARKRSAEPEPQEERNDPIPF